jgi:hypothetical protein
MINHPTTPPIAQMSIVNTLMGISSARTRFVRNSRTTPIWPIDDEPSQKPPASRQEEQDPHYHQYEYDEFHHSPFYMAHSAVS